MTDQYQRQWLTMIAKRNEEREKAEIEKSRKKHYAKHAAIHQSVVHKPPTVLEKDITTLFKMTKFKKIGPKIESHRPVKLPSLKKEVTIVV